jgi:hypothetical protein
LPTYSSASTSTVEVKVLNVITITINTKGTLKIEYSARQTSDRCEGRIRCSDGGVGILS